MEIDYEAIGNGIRDLLARELSTTYVSGIKVEVNPPEVGLSNVPEIGIYLPEEDPNEVEIGSSEPYETTLQWRLLCGVTRETNQEAVKAVWKLANDVKAALQKDRTLGGTVEASWRGKLTFDSVEGAGFWSAVNITLNAKMMA